MRSGRDALIFIKGIDKKKLKPSPGRAIDQATDLRGARCLLHDYQVSIVEMWFSLLCPQRSYGVAIFRIFHAVRVLYYLYIHRYLPKL